MILWFWIVVRIVVNPLSNVFQKLLARERAAPLFVVGITHGLLTVLCAGVFLIRPLPAAPEFWLNMTISAMLAIAGNVLIVQALKTSDLSFLGPVNAYKSIISLVPGMLLLHETPGPMALSGMTLVVAGSYLIMDKPPGADQNVFIRFFSDRGVRYRLAALVLSATEAIFLKRALLVTSPLMTFAVWAIAGFVFFVFMAFACCRRIEPVREVQLFQTHWPSYLALAATTGLMQLGTLVVLTGFQVAAALALFQTSILLTVFLGWKVFHEQHFTRRFLGALVMVGGAVLIIVSR